jgi:hypothetical protein
MATVPPVFNYVSETAGNIKVTILNTSNYSSFPTTTYKYYLYNGTGVNNYNSASSYTNILGTSLNTSPTTTFNINVGEIIVPTAYFVYLIAQTTDTNNINVTSTPSIDANTFANITNMKNNVHALTYNGNLYASATTVLNRISFTTQTNTTITSAFASGCYGIEYANGNIYGLQLASSTVCNIYYYNVSNATKGTLIDSTKWGSTNITKYSSSYTGYSLTYFEGYLYAGFKGDATKGNGVISRVSVSNVNDNSFNWFVFTDRSGSTYNPVEINGMAAYAGNLYCSIANNGTNEHGIYRINISTRNVVRMISYPASTLSWGLIIQPPYLYYNQYKYNMSVDTTPENIQYRISKYLHLYNDISGNAAIYPITNTNTGLTIYNGMAYSVAYNDGSGKYVSRYNLAVNINVTIPNAPTLNSAVSGNTTIDITYTAPTNSGGNAIASYEYSTNGGSSYTNIGITQNNTYQITGLANGTTYTVSVRAINAIGNSLASNSIQTIPFTVPTAPILYAAEFGNQTIDISFSAPTSNGGNAIIGYNYSVDGVTYANIGFPANNKYQITGLSNRTTYNVSVRAQNARGNSAASNPIWACSPILPDPPVIYAVPLNQAVDISFTEPNNRGNVITRYEYSVNTVDINMFRSTAPSLPINNRFSITQLTNGTSYYIRMRSVNAVGTSIPSNLIVITPFTYPDKPTIISATPLNGSIRIKISPPANDGGNAITGYKYATVLGAI